MSLYVCSAYSIRVVKVLRTLQKLKLRSARLRLCSRLEIVTVGVTSRFLLVAKLIVVACVRARKVPVP